MEYCCIFCKFTNANSGIMFILFVLFGVMYTTFFDIKTLSQHVIQPIHVYMYTLNTN